MEGAGRVGLLFAAHPATAPPSTPVTSAAAQVKAGSVRSGIVIITGRVENRAYAPIVIDAIQGTEGVVAVRDRLSYPRGDERGGVTGGWR